MLKKVYLVGSGALLALYAAAAFCGWEVDALGQQGPPSGPPAVSGGHGARSSRSGGFWGGK